MPKYTEEEFDKMLKKDEETYANILSARKQLEIIEKSWKDGYPSTDQQIDTIFKTEQRIAELEASYNARQTDYQTNKTYTFAQETSKWVSELTDDITGWFGLGALPALVIPVAWIVGVTATVGVIAYFMEKYHSKTLVDYEASANMISEVAKVNPELAKEMYNKLLKAKAKENSSSSTTKIVTGLLFVGLLYGGYKIYQSKGEMLKKLIT